jgi:hypothetical protein
MEQIDSVKQAYDKVVDFMIASEFKSYDPYDGANITLPFSNNYPVRLLSTYINKFSPLNIRPLLKIPLSKQNQALAFIGRAMLYRPDRYEKEINEITRHLKDKSLIKDHGYHCWDSHGFKIQMRRGLFSPGMVDIIGTEAIARFFLLLNKIKPDSENEEICLNVRDFFLKELMTKNSGVTFFRYKPNTKLHQWCYNASILCAIYIEKSGSCFLKEDSNEKAADAIRDIIDKQKPEGEWGYSFDFETKFERTQIDFHQGFILDALLEYMEINGFVEPYISSYKKGLEFYHEKQFHPNGQGIYRHPKKWPVNIHNQAQGIITFSRAAKAGFGEQYLDFAQTIAEWTIKNMQDKDGHFYYLKYPLFTNKIPYIRWSDAAMAYALAVFLEIRDQGLETRNGKSKNA